MEKWLMVDRKFQKAVEGKLGGDTFRFIENLGGD